MQILATIKEENNKKENKKMIIIVFLAASLTVTINHNEVVNYWNLPCVLFFFQTLYIHLSVVNVCSIDSICRSKTSKNKSHTVLATFFLQTSISR